MVFYVGSSDSINSPSIAIPPGTEVGDTLIALGYGPDIQVTDSRFQHVASLPGGSDPHSVWNKADVWWAEWDGDSSAVTYSYSAPNAGVLMAAYRTPTPGVTGVVTTAGGRPTPLPQLGQSTRAVVAVVTTSGVVDSFPEIVGYNADAGYTGGLPKVALTLHSWEGDRGLTPAADLTGNGDDPYFHLALIRLNPVGVWIPPCRLTGRGDNKDLGGGRLYPFAKTQQGGFRTSGTY